MSATDQNSNDVRQVAEMIVKNAKDPEYSNMRLLMTEYFRNEYSELDEEIQEDVLEAANHVWGKYLEKVSSVAEENTQEFVKGMIEKDEKYVLEMPSSWRETMYEVVNKHVEEVDDELSDLISYTLSEFPKESRAESLGIKGEIAEETLQKFNGAIETSENESSGEKEWDDPFRHIH